MRAAERQTKLDGLALLEVTAAILALLAVTATIEQPTWAVDAHKQEAGKEECCSHK